MTHRVVVTQKAKDDLQHYFEVAGKHAPDTAARWLDGFEEALQTLSEAPDRCPLAPENELVDQTIYQFFYGKRRGRYRVVFTIQDDQVLILHVRRGTMDKATQEDWSS